MAILSSPGSTNEVDTANIQVSTVSTPVSTVSTHDNTTNLSDATVYAFLTNQPNRSQLVHEDLEQIHEDDLEEMDLKWQLALLSMRARRYFQRTGKKITINGSDTASYEKTKVECFNCHKMRHFARECRSLRNKESRPKNQDSSRKTINVEDTSSKAMVAINGAEFNKTEFDLATYKRGLAYVEEQLVFYKKNKVMFCDQIVVLKRDASFKDLEINALNLQIEKIKKEKESNEIKIDNFENASKSIDKMIRSQIYDNSRTGLGFASYNVVAPPPTSLFTPLTIDLSNSGLEEFQHPEFKGYGPKASKSVYEDTSNEIKKALDAPIIEDWVSDSDVDESKVMVLIYDNVQHKPENFAPTAVLTKSGIVPISTSRQSSSRAAAPVSAARPINTAAPKPLVNVAKPRQNSLQKTHSLSRRPFYQQTTLKSRNLNNKINTAKVWRPKIKVQDHVSKNSGSYICDPQDALKDQRYFDSGCSRHMTGNISYLTNFKEHDRGNSCIYDPNPNSFDCPPDSYHPPNPTYETYSSDSCGNDSNFGYDYPPQFPLNYEPEPAYIQNYTSYPHDSPSFPQQYLCCDNSGGPHETSQCQPMNQNFYNSNSLGFNQTQPPQFPVTHQPPQETSIEILHDQENVINVVQTFLRKFNCYSFFETPKVLLLAWDRVFEIKDTFGNEQYKPEDIQELFHKLLDDLQNIHEELAEYINSSGWNRPAIYDDDDDDVDYTIAITPVLSTEEPDNSLSMGDEHLDTILATESDEVIKSSVENLVPIPSESEGIPDTMCDVHLVNNPTPLEAKDHFEFVINSNDDYSSSDDDSLYNENIEYVEASPPDSEVVSLEVAEIVIPEDEEIENDNLRIKLLKVNLLIAEIEALKDNPTLFFEFLTKSSSTSPKSVLEETNTFDDSL
nr:ribonuclease H-like domain-containing protein [Tanacetum cinerariifolium]